MQTNVPDSLAPGLTDQQLECLHVLRDGKWHDRDEISREIRNYISANISGRIIRPLEKSGIVEQEERPIKERSGKKKKLARIRKDIDERRLHLLIEYSANDLVCKYSEKIRAKIDVDKNTEKAHFYLKIRDKSIKRLEELEKLKEERQQKIEDEYFNQKLQLGSESYQELVAMHKIIYRTLKPICKRCCEKSGRSEDDCSLLKLPGATFLAAANFRWRNFVIQK